MSHIPFQNGKGIQMTTKVLNAKSPLGWNPLGNQKYYYDFGTGEKIPIEKNKAKTTTPQNSSKIISQPKKEKDSFLEGFNLYSDRQENSNILNSFAEIGKLTAQRQEERNERIDDFLSGFNQVRDEEIAEIREKEKIFNPKPREPVFKVGQDGAVASNLPNFTKNGKLELRPVNYSDLASSQKDEKPKEKSKWQKGLDYASTALTAASLIPGLDTFTNILQIPVDLLRGDFVGAGLDLVGVLPGVGEVADAAKTGRTVDRIVDGARAADKAFDTAKVMDKASDTMKVADDVADTAKAVDNAQTVALGDSLNLTQATGSRRNTLLSQVENSRVKEAINQIYRPNAKIGDGGTADAIRHELKTGEFVGKRPHYQKGKERLKSLQKILKEENLTFTEETVVRSLIDDLERALKGE